MASIGLLVSVRENGGEPQSTWAAWMIPLPFHLQTRCSPAIVRLGQSWRLRSWSTGDFQNREISPSGAQQFIQADAASRRGLIQVLGALKPTASGHHQAAFPLRWHPVAVPLRVGSNQALALMSNTVTTVGLILVALLVSACSPPASPVAALDSLEPGMPFDQVENRLVNAGWSPDPSGMTCGNGYDASCSVSFSTGGVSVCLLFTPTPTKPVFDQRLADEC